MTLSPYRVWVLLFVFSALAAGTACAKQNPSTPKLFFHSVDTKLNKKQVLSTAELTRLSSLAGDKDIFVRAHAITTLSWSKDNQGRQAADRVAHAHLNDSEWLVRYEALNALRRAHSPTVRDAARKMINDSNEKVRESANKILGKNAD